MAAWVKGAPTDAETAVRAAADLLAEARAPVVAGLNADLAAVRAAYRLADALGASVDPMASAGLYAELGSLSVHGAMTTTPVETLGRADVVLSVGARPWDDAFTAEVARTTPTRGRTAGAGRTILALGGPDGPDRTTYGVGNAGLAAAVGHLRACARGHLGGEAPEADIARRLAAARYGVVIYDAAELGEHGSEMLQGLIRDLNETTRVFALPMADPYQGRAVLQLSAWTTGQAPRTGFGRGLPEHDPWRFDSTRQAASGETDAALWVASLPSPRPDWLGTVRSVAVVGEGSPEAAGGTAEVVIAVGIPGEGVGGTLWNDRRGVVAYVAGATPGGGTPAASVIADIHAQVRARRDDGQPRRKDASC